MKQDFTYLSKDRKTQIHAIAWIPDGNVKAILQLCHGMVEFVDRYSNFAEHLNQYGYYVVGNDHLGHGKSVRDEDQYGYFHQPDGNACVIGDIQTLREITQKQYPNIPYFILGHSMGSFLIRQYIQTYGNGLAGAIIMGTGSQPGIVLAAGKILCRVIAAFRGWHYRSSLIDGMAFGSYNKSFEPARTPYDWLTKDSRIVDAYLAHPWCTFRFTVNAYYNLFLTIQNAQNPRRIRRIPKSLPLLLVSGACDPVGANGKGVTQAYQSYRKAGIQDLEMKLYENDRHEILNETDRDTVYADILKWLENLQPYAVDQIADSETP
ncbi:MAG: alpha/beta hydrolase [Clostridiales bacterium]|nr:alpha/beta hydrolase [Clostridiales bacterium]